MTDAERTLPVILRGGLHVVLIGDPKTRTAKFYGFTDDGTKWVGAIRRMFGQAEATKAQANVNSLYDEEVRGHAETIREKPQTHVIVERFPMAHIHQTTVQDVALKMTYQGASSPSRAKELSTTWNAS